MIMNIMIIIIRRPISGRACETPPVRPNIQTPKENKEDKEANIQTSELQTSQHPNFSKHPNLQDSTSKLLQTSKHPNFQDFQISKHPNIPTSKLLQTTKHPNFSQPASPSSQPRSSDPGVFVFFSGPTRNHSVVRGGTSWPPADLT